LPDTSTKRKRRKKKMSEESQEHDKEIRNELWTRKKDRAGADDEKKPF
jgi:hypothetical protein